MRTTRRQFLASTAALTALPALPACARGQAAAPGDVAAEPLLAATAEQLVTDDPAQATSLGIDKGERTHLRSMLQDRSAAGLKKVADALRARVAELKALNVDTLSPVMRTNVETVRTSLELALDGFAFPYGDVAVGGWRNSPYAVAQNIGAYLDTPRFLETDYTGRTAEDARSWLAPFEQ